MILLLLLSIVALAAFLRLYHITTTPPGLYPDEAMNGNNAAEVAQTGHMQPFYIEDNGREGLYINILASFIKWFGNEPWVVRLPAAIAGILTVLGIYFLASTLFESQAIALLSTFFLATSFWHINFSRIGFRAILAPFCLVWAMYFLLKALKEGSAIPAAEPGSRTADSGSQVKPGITRRSIFFLAAAGIGYGLGFYTYIAYRITPLLLLLLIPFFRKTPHFWKKMILFLGVAFIVALPIGVYFLQHPGDFFGRTSEIAVTNSGNPIGHFAANIVKTLAMFNFQGDGNWRHNVAGAPELWWPVGILFVIGIGWGIYYLWHWHVLRRKNFKSQNQSSHFNTRYLAFGICFTFLWFLLALLPAAASDEGLPHALRSILMLPPAILFAAIGGVWLYRFGVRYWAPGAKIIAAVFLAAAAFYAYYDYFIVWAENPNVPGAFNADYVAIGNQINTLPASEPKYVVVEAGGVLARGIPVPAETVMFVTDSFTTSTQLAHHITYLLPGQIDEIPSSTPSGTIFYVR